MHGDHDTAQPPTNPTYGFTMWKHTRPCYSALLVSMERRIFFLPLPHLPLTSKNDDGDKDGQS